MAELKKGQVRGGGQVEEIETYVIHAKTERSTMSIGTNDPVDALKRASEMVRPGMSITITDRDGNQHTVEELEANIESGKYAKPDSSR